MRVSSVQDGDSLVIQRASSGSKDEFRLRLYAIDAPESDQKFGRDAREYLGHLVRGRTDLVVEPVDTDRYGRLVGILYYRAAGRQQSVNRMMVEQGLARWYSRYGGRELGVDQAEREAKRRGRGIWGSGRQVAPWDHRRAQRRAASGHSLLKLLLLATVVSVVVVVAFYFVRQAL